VNAKTRTEDTLDVSIEVRESNSMVLLAFDKTVSWIGLEPLLALKVAEQMRCAAVSILRSEPSIHPLPTVGDT
jgi:hypothetical protein